MAAQSRALGRRSSACWDRGFESHEGHVCLSLVQCLCCQVQVCAAGRSLVQRSPTDCVVFEREQVEIKTLYTYCEQVGRRGKDYETKRKERHFIALWFKDTLNSSGS
jgi:hypothetical protein